MDEPNKLLVVDNDFHAYDTPAALIQAIDDLRKEGLRWAYYLQDHHRCKEAIDGAHYHALLIDNDGDIGLKTLNEIIPVHIPIAYVSAFTLEELKRKYPLLENTRNGKLNPTCFKEFGIRFMRKRDIVDHIITRNGKTTTTSELVDEPGVTFKTLQMELYNFLKSLSS